MKQFNYWIILIYFSTIIIVSHESKLSNNRTILFGNSDIIKFHKGHHDNSTIYLAYANDPFGSSKKVLKLTNSKEVYRSKRGIIHLYNMVECATGCNPLIYKGYGCFCGFLGSGYPVDGIDRCCKMHDWCYDTANCPSFLEYFVPYYWKCYRNRPLCAFEHGEWGGTGSCAQRLCECDRALSKCLSHYPCPSTRAFCRSSPWRLLQNAFLIFR